MRTLSPVPLPARARCTHLLRSLYGDAPSAARTMTSHPSTHRTPSLLVAALFAFAAPAYAVTVRPGHVAIVDAPRGVSPFRLPAQPWRALRRVELPSPCAQPAVLLPDGTVAVGLDAPPGIAFITRGGDAVTSVRLPARISQPLAVGLDGRLFVTAGRAVLTVAPDGTVRAVAEFTGHAETPAYVRSDGSAVVITTPNARSLEFVSLSAVGDVARVSTVQTALNAAAVFDDDRVAAVNAAQLFTVDLRGRIATLPAPPGVRHLASQGGTLAFATESELLLADPQARVHTAVPLRGRAAWVAGVDGGRFAVALEIPNASAEVWIIERDGSVSSRTPTASETRAPLVDTTGALLLAARNGDVVAIDGDGRERWRLSMHETLRPPAAPLPRGGVAIATEGNALLIVDDAP